MNDRETEPHHKEESMPFRWFCRSKTSSDERINQIHQKVIELSRIYEARQKHYSSNGPNQKHIATTLNNLRSTLPEQRDARVSALEAKLSILTELYEVWAGRNTDRAAIINLGLRVGRLEPNADADEKKMQGTNLAIFVTFGLFVMSVVTAVVYLAILKRGATQTWELLSYLAPALAALFAGLTAYVKKFEVYFFWASTLLILGGVGAFSASKGITSGLIWNWMIGYGAAASLYLGPYVLILRKPKRNASIYVKIATVVCVVLLFLLVGYDYYASKGTPNVDFNNDIKKVEQRLGFPSPATTSDVPRSGDEGSK